MSISVIINGALGKMGQTAVKAITEADDLNLIAALDKKDNLQKMLSLHKPDVVVDLTHPDAVYQNTKTLIENNVNPVIGTTGLSTAQLEELQAEAKSKQLGGIVVPNFSIAAILMMKAAALSAKHLSTCEIIEAHHPNKADSPSGTAIKTAEIIADNLGDNYIPSATIDLPGRGHNVNGIPVHAVRLPGVIAEQTVWFGHPGETLTITHQTKSREAFMPGLLLAIRSVKNLTTLEYGLEAIL